MKTQEYLFELKFPYIDKILLSKKRNPKYYSTKKGVGRKVFPIISRISKKILDFILYVDTDGYVRDSQTNERIISNIRTVGKPKYWVINFQDIWNGVIRFVARNNIMIKLKNEFGPLIEASDLKPITEYPIRLELFIFAQKMPVDVDNKGVIYFKCFQDILKDKYITDDSSEYINDTGRIKWIRVEENQEEFMIFRISKSDNNYD